MTKNGYVNISIGYILTAYILGALVIIFLFYMMFQYKFVMNISEIVDNRFSHNNNNNNDDLTDKIISGISTNPPDTKRFMNIPVIFTSPNDIIIYPRDSNIKIPGLNAKDMPKHNFCCKVDTRKICSQDTDPDSGIICIIDNNRLRIQLYGPIFEKSKHYDCDLYWGTQ
jgi:hypothetical protein